MNSIVFLELFCIVLFGSGGGGALVWFGFVWCCFGHFLPDSFFLHIIVSDFEKKKKNIVTLNPEAKEHTVYP